MKVDILKDAKYLVKGHAISLESATYP